MTSSSDRLDRIEAIVESNARAIAANATAIAEMRQAMAEADDRLRTNMEDVTSMIVSLAQEQDERVQETDRQLQILIDEGQVSRRQQDERVQETDRQLQILIDEGRVSRRQRDERAQETDRQFQILIDEGRVNRREHAEFREFMQLTLREIQQIKQQLAG